MFGIEKNELPGFVSFMMGVWAIVIGIMLVSGCIVPLPESNTNYVFVESKDIPRNPNNSWMGVSGCAQTINGTYFVTIDRDLPPVLANLVIRHENCHVQQYKSGRGRNMTSEEREMACYTRMWLP
jgi:hypothetical protein